MALPFEQELLALPLKKLLRVTSLLTETYPKEVAEARLFAHKKGEEQKKRIANRLIESVLPFSLRMRMGDRDALGLVCLYWLTRTSLLSQRGMFWTMQANPHSWYLQAES